MITTLKDEEGKIISFCEWRLVGRSGYDKKGGEYIWIENLWVHNNFQRTMRINRIIDEIMRKAPTAKYGYFRRQKYGGRMKIFTREQWERRRREYDPLINQGEK